jgi:hypothetical protein
MAEEVEAPLTDGEARVSQERSVATESIEDEATGLRGKILVVPQAVHVEQRR